MIKNYIKIALRNLGRNKVYSLINILGLTIGLAACLLVSTVVIDDLSYDRNWKNADNIYRIISVDKSNKNAENKFAVSYTGLGPELKKNFPEVTDFCRISGQERRLKMGDGKDGVLLNSMGAEPSIWSVLDFKVTEGNPQKFVNGYVNLVISEKIKNQYFPKSDPVGQLVYTIPDYGKPQTYLITGVIKDIPSNTHLRADVIELREHSTADNQLNKDGSGTFLSQYLLLRPDTRIGNFTNKFNAWYKNFMPPGKANLSFQLQSIKDAYLHSEFTDTQTVQGSIRNVYIFSGVAILLLLIACINFINLTTARALKRLREAGIRKVLGAGRKQLIAQFLFESLLFFAISFVLGLVFYNIFLVSIEKFLEHPLSLKLYSNVILLACTCGFVLLISILTGLYPAFLLSGRNPLDTIGNKPNTTAGSGLLRKGLVVVQFVISIAIIVSAFVVHNQLQFIDHKDLGYDKNNLLSVNFSSFDEKGKSFKQELLRLPGVENVSVSSWAPSNGGGTMSMEFDDPIQKGNKIKVWYIEADRDFAATMKLQLKSGRLFDPNLYNDALNSDSLSNLKQYDKIDNIQRTQPVIITAYTAKTFDVNELNVKGAFKEGTPVGIIKDFNNETLHDNLKPTVIRAVSDPAYGYVLVRIKPNTTKQAMAAIEHVWQQFYPEKIFQYTWVDEKLAELYKGERKLQQLFTFFSLLVVFLACLGLFGLAAFTAEQRTKEIGIRKVLGASVAGITTLLSQEFLKLVLIATLIASPIAWYAMNKWLQDFAYRISIEWWIFALAGGITVLIAFITVSFQSVKAAIANPVKSLRSE